VSSTWGANLKTLRQVYQAMILPQMLYGCSAWYKTRLLHPSGELYKSQSRMARLLAPIQKRAAQIIARAFRTTAASAVEIEAYLLPIGQQIQKTSLQTTLRILSTPLYTTISAQSNTKSKTNRSLLTGASQKHSTETI
jgi:hypothetical protein